MEIKSIPLSVPDLKQVVIKSFFDDSDFLSCVFKLEVHGLIFLVIKACV